MNSDEEIYRAYPRHVAPVAAKKAIARAVRELAKEVGENQARQQIMEATQAFADSPAGNNFEILTDGIKKDYRPYPATWYNRGSYADDPSEWMVSNGKNTAQRFETRNEKALRESLGQGTFDGISESYSSNRPVQ